MTRDGDEHVCVSCVPVERLALGHVGLSILFEAYDPSFMALFDERLCDVAHDSCVWHDDRSPVKAMLDGVPKICVLTHPHQWHPAPILDARENLQRLFQELYYRSMDLVAPRGEKTVSRERP